MKELEGANCNWFAWSWERYTFQAQDRIGTRIKGHEASYFFLFKVGQSDNTLRGLSRGSRHHLGTPPQVGPGHVLRPLK